MKLLSICKPQVRCDTNIQISRSRLTSMRIVRSSSLCVRLSMASVFARISLLVFSARCSGSSIFSPALRVLLQLPHGACSIAFASADAPPPLDLACRFASSSCALSSASFCLASSSSSGSPRLGGSTGARGPRPRRDALRWSTWSSFAMRSAPSGPRPRPACGASRRRSSERCAPCSLRP